ncbi:Os12g0103700 [Oryza sativa Japonica Group]|uniref:Os12g0103700 protein n=1 Tax=Oryza sativa subsp. japonica TaxID=39947 RepID=Q2QYX2_ORYSJ|nr:hypothetical protein LOC_Os12g01300 [Oryza sativa Japonica Group]BAT15471.1 Os12g0103700 [Oryza sativa Japonica Group]
MPDVPLLADGANEQWPARTPEPLHRAGERVAAVVCGADTIARRHRGRHARGPRQRTARSPHFTPRAADVLNWSDKPVCQEKAAYILMVLAHRSYASWSPLPRRGSQDAEHGGNLPALGLEGRREGARGGRHARGSLPAPGSD